MQPRKFGFVATSVLIAAFAWAGEDGAALFAKKCSACHTVGGSGGKMAASMGGALDGVGSRRDAEWLRAYLADPRSKIDHSKKPVLALTPEELDTLADYVLSLK